MDAKHGMVYCTVSVTCIYNVYIYYIYITFIILIVGFIGIVFHVRCIRNIHTLPVLCCTMLHRTCPLCMRLYVDMNVSNDRMG